MTGGTVFPSGLCCSSSLCDIVSVTNTDRLWRLYCKQTEETFFPTSACSGIVMCAFHLILPVLLWNTCTALQKQTPTHTCKHSKHTQSPPNTPPTVTTSEEWSACGEVVVKKKKKKVVGGQVETQERRHSAAFNPQMLSDVPFRVQRDSICSAQTDGNLRVERP